MGGTSVSRQAAGRWRCTCAGVTWLLARKKGCDVSRASNEARDAHVLTTRLGARAAGMSDAEALAAIEAIRAVLGVAADVHLFSSTEGRYDSAAFDVFRARGVTVQLDGDPLVAWAHFAEADVLVMGKSSFSRAAAWLNSRCVVHQGWGHPAPAWVHLNALLGPDRRAGAAPLAHCLGRLRSTYHP